MKLYLLVIVQSLVTTSQNMTTSDPVNVVDLTNVISGISQIHLAKAVLRLASSAIASQKICRELNSSATHNMALYRTDVPKRTCSVLIMLFSSKALSGICGSLERVRNCQSSSSAGQTGSVHDIPHIAQMWRHILKERVSDKISSQFPVCPVLMLCHQWSSCIYHLELLHVWGWIDLLRNLSPLFWKISDKHV